MSLTEVIRSQLTTSIKEKNEVKKGILRVILGDLSTLASRSGKNPTDDDVKKVVKKLLEGNNETLKLCKDHQHGTVAKLSAENEILLSLLPKTLTLEEVRSTLQGLMPLSSCMVIYDIGNAKSDGQATGVAMKYFKEKNLSVEGTDVATVVKEIRSLFVTEKP